jgi:Aldo/keto reductase family
MEYTSLGRTGLRVSRVGCGGGGIGQVWGPTTEAESVRTIHRALALGVNFFDVAPGYGDGKAEDVLGRALHGRQEPVVVATKVRLAAEEMHDVAGAVRTSVEASLRRLRRETVDVLHIHNRFTPRRGDLPHSLSADDALGPVLDAYRQMQQTGKTRFIGLSAMEPDVPTVRRPGVLQSAELDGARAGTTWGATLGQRPDYPAGYLAAHGRDRDPIPRRWGVEPAGRPVHPTGHPPGTGCGSGPHLGLPAGRSPPDLVAGGDGLLPDESGHCDHRAWCEKCGGDGRTGGVCRPAPDSAAASRALTRPLRP